MNLMVADGVALVWGVREAVLVAQIFFDLGVDGVNRLLFGDFEHAPACFLGKLLEDFLAVGALFLWWESAAVHSAMLPHPESAGTAVFFVVGKQNRIDDRVGALCGGDSLRQSLFAAVIHAVREDNQRLAALLLAHEFVGRQENRVVKQRSRSEE